MTTEVYRLSPEDIDSGIIQKAGEVIRRGGLVAFPTETVYGLGGDALNSEASKKIYAAKGRPSDNPLIVHIAEEDALIPLVREVPEKGRLLMHAFWPGPLTLIFRKTEMVPLKTSGGLPTVAVRMPVDPIAAALIRASGGYIAAPSANSSGRPSPTTAEHVVRDLDGRVDMILDGGPCDIGLESTIVDLTEDVPVILRPGFINEEMLKEVLGEVKLDPGLLDAGANAGIRPKAPGMRYRHYAPKAPLAIVEGEAREVTEALKTLAGKAILDGKRVGILASDDMARDLAETFLPGTPGAAERLYLCPAGSRAEEQTIARHLFAILREFDDAGVDLIYAESFETPELGMAIMNRLLKAAGHRVILAADAISEGDM